MIKVAFLFVASAFFVLGASAAETAMPKDYLSLVVGQKNLKIFQAIVSNDKELSETVPKLANVHPVVPNDKAFIKLLKALGSDEVNALVSDLMKDPTNIDKAVNVVKKAVPLFDAIKGLPTIKDVVLYHVLVGGGDLSTRSGPQDTALKGKKVTVMSELHEEHDGHDDGDEHEGHDDEGEHDDDEDGHDHEHENMKATSHKEEAHDDDEHHGHGDGHDDNHHGDEKDEMHYVIVDQDPSRGNAHVDVTVITGQGYASVIDAVLMPVDLSGAVSSAPTATEEGEAATATTEPEEKDGVCFPADAQILAANGNAVRMADLNAGDKIRNHHIKEISSRVFLFSHRDSKAQVEFVRVETASGHVVRATGNHYLYVDGKLRAFGAVKKGDLVHTVKGDSRVVKVSRVIGRGLYAPHAMHSDIVVDGVLVSSYSTAVHPRWAEAMLAPVRMVARLGITEPLGGLLYNGADRVVGTLPKGSRVN